MIRNIRKTINQEKEDLSLNMADLQINCKHKAKIKWAIITWKKIMSKKIY